MTARGTRLTWRQWSCDDAVTRDGAGNGGFAEETEVGAAVNICVAAMGKSAQP